MGPRESGPATAARRVARVGEASRASSGIDLHIALRMACAMCFIGHGAWGVITKAGWLPFYGLFGIPNAIAWKTMPIVGIVDILVGVVALLRPVRAALAYMVGWAVFTALLRPAAGMGWWEFVERGGNYGPPLALYLLRHDQALGWFAHVAPGEPSQAAVRRASWVLRASIALLLIGHGGFALVQEKPILLAHWRSVGVHGGVFFLQVVGALEIAAGVAALAWPTRPLLIAIACWKIGTELLYPISGRLLDAWEWVERGGDYLAPFALLIALALMGHARRQQPTHGGNAGGRQGVDRKRNGHFTFRKSTVL